MPLDSSYNVLFITPQAVIDNGYVDSNIDPKVITTSIRLVQDQWLQGVLGTPMLVYLQDEIAANSGSLTNPNDQNIMQWYIEPAMVWYTTYELCFFNSNKIKIKGLEKMSGESSTAASLAEIQTFQNHCKERAEFYAQRLLRYMEGFPQYYPAFWNASVNIADLQPNRRTGYQSSMYLGNDKGYWDYGRRYGGYGLGEWFFEFY